jgi:hypothetical protein
MALNKVNSLFSFLKRGLPFILLGANLAWIIWGVIHYLNLSFPLIGRDYLVTVPGMLDTKLFYRLNGLAIQWYTPSFGGGMPVYPDPNSAQFSLWVLLNVLFPVWKAVTISAAIYIAVGFLAGYYFFKKVLGAAWIPSLLGTVFFSLNGFIMQRIAMGQLGYETFPLLPIFLILLCDSSISRKLAAMFFGLLITLLIHQAGYFILVVFCLSMSMTFPLIYIYNPKIIHWRSVFQVAFFGGLAALFMTASKLSAVYSFMRFFPRLVKDVSDLGTLSGLAGISYQLLGTMNLTPLFGVTGLGLNQIPQFMQAASGSVYGFWEFDMSLSPVVFGILIGGIIGFLFTPRKYFRKLAENKKWIALLLLLFSTWLTVEFVLARGLIYPLIRNLPILSSLHVNMRFTSAFLFPLALAAAIIYNKWSDKWSPQISYPVFFILNILTLLPLVSYFLIPAYLYLRDYDVTEMLITDRQIDSGSSFRIKRIEAAVDNSRAMKRGVSNLSPYNPIFGYDLRYFHPELKAGSVWEISNGYYNMTNPTGFVFPEVNGTRSFERIRVDDGENLKLFTMHLQPNWKLPLYQQFFDWFSGLSFIGIVGATFIHFFKKVLDFCKTFPTEGLAKWFKGG